MIPRLWAASGRHLLRHPAQLLLALTGLAVGVATIIAVDIATASAGRAFQLSMRAVNGAATHQILGGPQGIDEQLYVQLQRTHWRAEGLAFAPLVEGYVDIGARTLQLIGVDPFASPRFDTSALPSVPAAAGLQQWLLQPGAAVLGTRTAAALALKSGDKFDLEAGGRVRQATLIGTIDDEGGGYDALLLTDIAQAQEWLRREGRLSRIDVQAPQGPGGTQLIRQLQELLPAGLRLEPSQARSRQSLQMTAAFTANLQAMSLLALMVSTLLIYGAVSFAVVQRRRVMGVLRALGATRAELLAIVLGEALLLGMLGAAAGLVLGSVIGRGLVQLVSRTINDLYFVVAVNQSVLPATSIAKALLAGLGAALAGALVPALEVAASAPQLGLRRSVLESRATRLARRLPLLSALLTLAAGAIAVGSSRSLLAGFVALFLLLTAVAALTPAVLRALALLGARRLARASPIGRLALSDTAASLSRTGVAVAALGMAIAAMIGVSIMVASFRESLRAWLTHTMRADIYVTAPGTGAGRPERRIDPQLLEQLLHAPGVRDFGLSRRVLIELPGGPVPLDAVQLARGGYAAMDVTEGDPAVVWPAFERGAVLVSEPLAWRLQLHSGSELGLPTDSGVHRVKVAGIYREYGNERGTVLISLAEYRRVWQDEAITAFGVYVSGASSVPQVEAAFRTASAGKQALYIRSNADLRALSMQIFERTFVITRVLYWLAAGVAAIGLVSALLAWELERARELAILRALGVTPRGMALLIEAQTLFMGCVALLAAIPAGLLTAWLLIEVINRRAFGWRIDVHLSAAQFTNALLLAITAALLAGVYPAVRTARASIAADLREE